MEPALVVATEALADGSVTRRELTRCYTKLQRNVYVRSGVELTARDRGRAAWLWSGRTGTLVGQSAAAHLGSRWIPADAPVELVHTRRPPPNGIVVRSNVVRPDEIRTIDGIVCTTAARTAYDLGRRLPLDTAVIRIDALLNATRCGAGARGVRRLRAALELVDAGAESSQETRLRLLLVRAPGLPRPVTQIAVVNRWGQVERRIDMGYRKWLVGVEYDGERHWRDPRQHACLRLLSRSVYRMRALGGGVRGAGTACASR